VVADAIQNGKIVKVISDEIKTDDGYYLVYPVQNSKIKQIKELKNWLTKILSLNEAR